jgi:hypothetical protein
MIDAMRAGAEEFGNLWQVILTQANFSRAKEIASSSYEDYTFPSDLWAKVVFDFALAYNKSGLEKEEVISAMTPLYYGRTAGLVLETLEMTNAQAEEVIQAQARKFEELKPYLLERWASA